MFFARSTRHYVLLAFAASVFQSTIAQESSKTLSQDERSAMEAFAADMQAIKEWVRKETVGSEGTGVSELITRRNLTTKLAKVRTTGLPSMLDKAFSAYVSAEADDAKLYTEMPSGEAGIAWLEAMEKNDKSRAACDQAFSKRTEAQGALIGVAADYDQQPSRSFQCCTDF